MQTIVPAPGGREQNRTHNKSSISVSPQTLFFFVTAECSIYTWNIHRKKVTKLEIEKLFPTIRLCTQTGFTSPWMAQHYSCTYISYQFVLQHKVIVKVWIFSEVQRMSPEPLLSGGVWEQDAVVCSPGLLISIFEWSIKGVREVQLVLCHMINCQAFPNIQVP